MRGLKLLVVLLTLSLGAVTLLPATPAPALSSVVVDCTTHNQLTHQYTVAQLRDALATMSADVKEYTACPDIIQRTLNAQLGGLHASGGGSGSGGSFLPTPVIVILVLLLLGGAGFAVVAARRRGGPDAD